MEEKIVLSPHDKPESISKEIWNRTKEPFRFDSRDISEYYWVSTQCFCDAWNLPIYRNLWKLYEFFIPGLTQSMVNHLIGSVDFYPLLPEEKKRAEKIIQETFEEQLEREVSCLLDYLRNNVRENSFVQLDVKNIKPREFTILFGDELYKGENKEDFRLRKSSLGWQPSVEIYVWKNGFRPSGPRKID